MSRQILLLRVFLILLVLVGPAARAESEPARPPDFWTITKTFPEADATNVLRDGFVLFEFEAVVADGDPVFVRPSPDELLQLTVRDTVTSELVEGQIGSWGGGPQYLWRSTKPLEAHRTYELAAKLEQPFERPSAATGVTELQLSFLTGDQFAPPLEIDGALTFEIHDSMLGTTAAVQFPVATGGLPEHGFTFRVWLTRETPRAVGRTLPQEGAHVLANGSGEFLAREDSYPLPESDTAYRPCITLEISDVVSSAAAFSCHTEFIQPGAPIGCGGCTGAGIGESALGLVVLGLWSRRQSRRNRRSSSAGSRAGEESEEFAP